jgi:NAD(P)-dependent dehydrogenase (short-subunit alcohol dehydrogenase family)
MAQRFTGKAAIVTGGASGIGRVVAQTFAAEGAQVIVATDSNVKGAEQTVAAIKATGGEALFIRCDVTEEADVAKLVRSCVSAYGRLDYAFNNAGVGPDGLRLPVVNVVDTPLEIWDKTVDVNLKGVFLCLKHEIRQMTAQGHGGAIVNTSSVGAVKPLPGFGAYSASKAGINILTQITALEVASLGIRVNAVMPCPTERTLLLENLSAASPEVKAGLASGIPLGRLATPEDMAAAVMWLCSDEAFVTGHALPVDGGMLST